VIDSVDTYFTSNFWKISEDSLSVYAHLTGVVCVQGDDVCATDENCTFRPEECQLSRGQALGSQDM